MQSFSLFLYLATALLSGVIAQSTSGRRPDVRERITNAKERNLRGVFRLTGNILWILIVYLAIMNILGIAVMGIDKRKAKRHAWRIPERVLFMVSIFGGSVGTLAGMYLFRHKTKHWYFVIGMPAILILHIAIGIYANVQHTGLRL